MGVNTICRSCYVPNSGDNTTAYWWQDHLVGLMLGEATNEAFERTLVRSCAADGIVDCHDTEQTEAMHRLEQELAAYYAGKATDFTVPITLYGTPFQKKIWTALRSVPYGSTTTYSELAVRAGVRGARATGSAVGANPIAIIVPCHRILPKSGKLGNYSTGRGPETKRELLALEAANNRGGIV